MPDTAPTDLDLTACAREPIHTPGSIQPHGHLLAFRESDFTLVQASADAGNVLTRDLPACWGQPLDGILRGDAGADLLEGLRRNLPERGPVQLGTVRVDPGAAYHAIAHRAGDLLVLELEAIPPAAAATLEELHPLLQAALGRLHGARTIEHLMTAAAAEVRRLTGFDRALIYRFDADWNGTVIAEDRNAHLPSYLDLRFPASDIPEQARQLYRRNRLRLIPDADYRPVPIRSGEGLAPPLDLTFSVLRSVSPVHVEYMKNMGTPASMSISLIHHDRLWGLISCHHAAPRQVPFAVRTACDLVGQVLSIQAAALEDSAEAGRRVHAQGITARLLGHMAAAGREFSEGLTAHAADLLGLAGAEGAAILFGEACARVGRTPPEADIRRLAAWLDERGGDDVFATESLAAEWPEAERLKDTASGVLAISISKLHASYVLWFRPEVVETVAWGGDPRKPVEVNSKDGARLHPRRSFEAWKEIVRLKALPWHPSEIEAAQDLRNGIVGVVLRQAEELAELNQELERSNKELAAFSYSISHDLRAPFRHIVGYSELLRELSADKLDETGRRFIDTIIESAQSAGKLVDSLLAFSQMGRTTLTKIDVGLNLVVDEVRRSLSPDMAGRRIVWTVAALPTVSGDPVLLRQLFENLISNAVKYTRDRAEAVIEIGAQRKRGEDIVFVRDNGVGFDMAYVDKLFGVFQRLHRVEDYEGIGIGLANVRRIAERHGGRAWAEGVLGEGATFFVALPRFEERR